MSEPYELAIVGAGLAALSALRAGAATGRTLVVDYQHSIGGMLRPALPAPGFAEHWELLQWADTLGRLDVDTHTARPARRDVDSRTATTAVGLLPAGAPSLPHTLLLRGRTGTWQASARRVLLACGGLEATREHAQIAGTRPAGVITPCMAHQLLARGYLPGRRCVLYGAGPYALATAWRLAASGAAVTLVPLPGEVAPEQTEAARVRVRVEASAGIVRLAGFPRLERVTLKRGDQETHLSADTLIYGAGMVANTHWLKGSGIDLDADGAVRVDTSYCTNVAGVYAAGTVVAPCIDHSRSLAMGVEVAHVLQR